MTNEDQPAHDPGPLTLDDLLSLDDAPPAQPRDSKATRRRRRGAIVSALVVVTALALVAGYVGLALTAPVAMPAAVTRDPVVSQPPTVRMIVPEEGVTGIRISGGDDYLGDAPRWLTAGDDAPRPIASITKVITALVVLDRHPLTDAGDDGPTLRFSRADHALYDEYYLKGATIAAMPTGSTMSQRDALEMMLVISASNYADAVATWAFGSRWAFLEAARSWLAENGLDDTTIVEPTGIDPRNTSTPADMVALGALAMAHPVVAEIVAMPALEVDGFGGANTNTALGHDGIRGVKTGTLNASGVNLLFSSLLDVGIGEPLEVTGVVLGGDHRSGVDAEVSRALASIRAGFRNVTVASAGNEVGTVTATWGPSASLVLARDATVFAWSDTPVTATLTVTGVRAGRRGEKVGTVTFATDAPGDAARSDTVDVILDADIEPPDTWWRLTHPAFLWGG